MYYGQSWTRDCPLGAWDPRPDPVQLQYASTLRLGHPGTNPAHLLTLVMKTVSILC